MAAPLSPLPVRGGGSHELPAYLSNGLIGLRVRDVPLLAGMSIISGLSGEDPERQIEAKAQSPYPVAADICISGVWLGETLHAVTPIEQRYDFSSSELTTQLRFEAKGIKARIDVLPSAAALHRVWSSKKYRWQSMALAISSCEP